MNLDLTRELEPDSENDDAEFKIAFPLTSWDEDDDKDDGHNEAAKPFDRSLNRYGAVYVRLLRAQRLPCPVGSSVVAATSLPPFSGRVKTIRKVSFLSTYEHGVCVKWDQEKDEGLCSMVNSWNNQDSPIPSIKIALLFSPLGMGWFDFTMCTVLLSCKVLLKTPGVWKSQWCQADLPDSMVANTSGDVPLIQLEAMFVPTTIDGSVLISPTGKKITLKTPRSPKRPVLPLSADSSPTKLEEPGKPAAQSPTDDDPTSPHLLRASSFWIPSACNVCSKILVGRNKGYHCEACSVICCGDCRLNVDLEIPCGSEEARSRVETSIQSKITVSNILSIIAPDEGYTEKSKIGDATVSGTTTTNNQDIQGGIGCLRIEFKRANLFEQPLPPDESPDAVFASIRPSRDGEYYARITSSMGGTKMARTRPVYSGNPHFNSKEIQFLVAHYGEEFRLDCVDAQTDEVVGTALLSTQGILQMQRDEVIQRYGASLFQCFRGPILERGVRPGIRVLLRKGVKNAFGLEFYVSSSEVGLEGRVTESEKGVISGWLEISLGLEEYFYRLYHPFKPVDCPERPPDEFNMAMFQVHIMRAKIILEQMNGILELYLYTVSWKDPLLTLTSLILVVLLCLRFNTEYVGSLPACAIALAMAYSSRRLSRKGRKEVFIKREVEASRKAGKIAVKYVLHRPVGTIGASIHGGRGLFSRDLGIPGMASCTVLYDPLRFASDTDLRSKVLEHDKAAESLHNIGCTTPLLSADPEWNDVHFPSVENMRLRQLLRHVDDFFADRPQMSSTGSKTLVFPVLQPFEIKGRRRDESGRLLDGILKDWETSTGAIVLQVRLSLGFDQILGEVVVPLSQLVAKGEIDGWFQVLEVGTKNLAPVLQVEPGDTSMDLPRIHATLNWNPPENKWDNEETQVEISYAIQEELIRSSQISKQAQFDLVGTSIGAVNTALGLGGTIQQVQNILGKILDYVESSLNAFNFTDPFKSSLLFTGSCVLSVILIVIPTRYIVLMGVLGQYAAAFVERYGPKFSRMMASIGLKKKMNEHKGENRHIDLTKDPAFLEKWMTNAIRSLPTYEDLRKAYFWESRRLGSRENEKFASEKRVSRLNRLWKASWHSTLEIRSIDAGSTKTTGVNGPPHWKNAFAVVEGRRFVFWDSVSAFDSGELASGLVILSGHAGIATPSPVEMREIPAEVAARVVTIFGKGSTGQQRITMVLPDATAREKFETTVTDIISKDD